MLDIDSRTRSLNGIIPGFPVVCSCIRRGSLNCELTIVQLSVEDVSMEREIYKGRGYRLHAAKTSGKMVAVKVYQGNRAREVSFTKMNYTNNCIHTDCFVEAVLGSRQIQPASYV